MYREKKDEYLKRCEAGLQKEMQDRKDKIFDLINSVDCGLDIGSVLRIVSNMTPDDLKMIQWCLTEVKELQESATKLSAELMWKSKQIDYISEDVRILKKQNDELLKLVRKMSEEQAKARTKSIVNEVSKYCE